MYCLKCGSKVVQGDSFCRMCGTSINTIDQLQMNNVNQSNVGVNESNNEVSQPVNNQIDNSINQSSMNNNQYMSTNQEVFNNQYYNQQVNYNSQYVESDEELKRAYVGPKYDDFSMGRGAAPLLVFFFGAFYTLYRKMYLLSILWLVGSVIISIFLPGFGSLISFGAKIFICVKFNDLYMKHVGDEVNKIKNENQGRSRNELINICARKGGTNVAIVIIMSIAYAFVIFVIFLLIATPILLNVINEADQEAEKNSALNYINSVEKQIVIDKTQNQYYVVPSVLTDPTEFSVKGDYPDDIYLYVDEETGTVISGTLTFDDTTYKYYNGEISVVEY